jgi:hypothetical protein
LPHTFTVFFSDKQPLEIDDIINFNTDQVNHITESVSQFTKQQLMAEKYGIEIKPELTEEQKAHILTEKERIVGTLSSKTLKDRSIARFGKHSLQRIFERVGSDTESTLISIIDKVKLTNTVQKGQFKGFPQLSYTLRILGDPDRYKISLSFEKVKSGDRIIKVVTVSNVQTSALSELGQRHSEQRIEVKDPKVAAMLEKIRNQYKKD